MASRMYTCMLGLSCGKTRYNKGSSGNAQACQMGAKGHSMLAMGLDTLAMLLRLSNLSSLRRIKLPNMLISDVSHTIVSRHIGMMRRPGSVKQCHALLDRSSISIPLSV